VVGVLFVSLLMIGCGGGGGDNNKKESSYFTVSFYDANLDLNATIGVDKSSPDINITKLKTDLALNATNLYRAGKESVETDALYHITGDTNFYADLNVTEITTQAELADINASAATLEGNYILLNDIALDDTKEGFDANGWKPMGDSSDSFTGIFNGSGHKITGLWIDRSSGYYIGFFGFAVGAQIKGFGVEMASDKNISGYSYVGAIAGYLNTNSQVTNSYTKGNINGTMVVGGIAGSLNNNSGISNSYSAASVTGSSTNIGGIAGSASRSKISNSYAVGNVNSPYDNVGGIVGLVQNSTEIINNAAINNLITGTPDANRIVGDITTADNTVKNNFALGSMTVNSAIYNGATNERNGTSKTMPELKTQSTYSSQVNGDGLGGLGWKFGNDASNPWKIDANKNGGLPYLYWENR
jgi:hypothetical protein